MLSCTRRELVAHFLGAPLLAACERGHVRAFDGALLGQDHKLGHRLRDGFAPEPQSRRSVQVAIVGAGVAGLSAAWRLERAGLRDFEVIELEQVAGGTARSGENSVSRIRGLLTTYRVRCRMRERCAACSSKWVWPRKTGRASWSTPKRRWYERLRSVCS